MAAPSFITVCAVYTGFQGREFSLLTKEIGGWFQLYHFTCGFRWQITRLSLSNWKSNVCTSLGCQSLGLWWDLVPELFSSSDQIQLNLLFLHLPDSHFCEGTWCSLFPMYHLSLLLILLFNYFHYKLCPLSSTIDYTQKMQCGTSASGIRN